MSVKPAEQGNNLYPKVRGYSTKKPCEQSPPSGEERWHLRRKGFDLGANEIYLPGKTFFSVRQDAAIIFGCEPGELTGEML